MKFASNDPTWEMGSWVESANEPLSGFPLQNLPFCSFLAADETYHLGIGIGDRVLDLHRCAEAEVLSVNESIRAACLMPTLNQLMHEPPSASVVLRRNLTDLLSRSATAQTAAELERYLIPMREARFGVPVAVGNYTDFYASIHHASNVGRLFRPDQPLLPNYKWVPIGYHGRASSLVASNTDIRRPQGQAKPAQAVSPIFGPTQQLDFELELGCYIGLGNALGTPIAVTAADQRIWGFSLLNDWSARDIQAWEYQPLGPFLGKSFATTVSPWVVTARALAPFRAEVTPRPDADPEPLPYLQSPTPESDAFDLTLEVHLTSERMRQHGLAPLRLTHSNARVLYWSFRQMIAHHSSNGCNLQTGDLLASGTISGPSEGSLGCLLEITERGTHPLTLPSGESRCFLEDGDEITLSGFGEREGLPRISLGECRGRIVGSASRQ